MKLPVITPSVLVPVQGCPCTPELLCESDNLGIFRKRQCKPESLRYCTVSLVEKARLGGKRTCKGFTGARKGARTGALLPTTVPTLNPCPDATLWRALSSSVFAPARKSAKQALGVSECPRA